LQLFSRRQFAALLSSLPAWAQGVATRSVSPAPRGKLSGLPFHARFTDVAAEAGLRAPVIYGGVDSKTYILETVGCGVAFFDYDNDGWLDIFVLSGQRLNEATPESHNRLYKNNRDGTFTDVTEKAGLKHSGWASSVCVGDYNNDGFEDLFVTYWGQNHLYRNNGDGTFTDVTEKAGLLQPANLWGAGCSFVETTRNGHLDLVIANYLDFDMAHTAKPGDNANCNWKGVPVSCGPRGLKPGRLFLFRNNGDGTFRDATKESGVGKVTGSYCMTVTTADFANTGWPDIYVACDSTPSFLLRNNKDGTFTDIGLESGAALSEDGMEQAGMGIGLGDFNLDGKLDLFKTHFADDTSVLYQNDGKANFTDVTVRSGLAVETRYTGWGTGVFDLDNDGLPDIFIVTGSVYPEVDRKLAAYPLKTPRVVFRNLGNGKFEELLEQAGPGVSAAHCSRGCAFGDFDNDGDIDMVVINLNEPPSLLRNDVAGGGHWLKVQLIGTKSNRSAIGTRVTVRYGSRTQVQEVTSQASFYSANDKRLHFGLGEAGSASMDIRWPSGETERVGNVAAGQLVKVKQGSGIVKTEKWRKE